MCVAVGDGGGEEWWCDVVGGRGCGGVVVGVT